MAAHIPPHVSPSHLLGVGVFVSSTGCDETRLISCVNIHSEGVSPAQFGFIWHLSGGLWRSAQRRC